MFATRNAVRVGLASAIFLTGCGAETIGNSVVAPQGECLAGKSTLELGTNQDMYLGGDLKIDNDHGVQDSLRLTNAGKGVLDVVRSHGDEGTVSFPSTGAQVAPNDQDKWNESPPSTNFSFDLSKMGSVVFNYEEDTAAITVTAAAQSQTISVQLVTTCSE